MWCGSLFIALENPPTPLGVSWRVRATLVYPPPTPSPGHLEFEIFPREGEGRGGRGGGQKWTAPPGAPGIR